MLFDIDFSDQALEDIAYLAMHEPKAYDKFLQLLEELKTHPQTGIGKPHQLTGNRSGQWSRSITKKHQLVYTIDGQLVIVFVVSAYGHYDDK